MQQGQQEPGLSPQPWGSPSHCPPSPHPALGQHSQGQVQPSDTERTRQREPARDDLASEASSKTQRPVTERSTHRRGAFPRKAWPCHYLVMLPGGHILGVASLCSPRGQSSTAQQVENFPGEAFPL